MLFSVQMVRKAYPRFTGQQFENIMNEDGLLMSCIMQIVYSLMNRLVALQLLEMVFNFCFYNMNLQYFFYIAQSDQFK